MTKKITLGDKIRRVKGSRAWSPAGHESMAVAMDGGTKYLGYFGTDGIASFMILDEWEVIEPQNNKGTPMTDWTKVPAGTKLRCILPFEDRLTLGNIYEFTRYVTRGVNRPGAVCIKACDKVDTEVNWGDGVSKDGTQHFEVIEESTPQDLLNELEWRQAAYENAAQDLANAEDDLQAMKEYLVNRLDLGV